MMSRPLSRLDYSKVMMSPHHNSLQGALQAEGENVSKLEKADILVILLKKLSCPNLLVQLDH